MLRLLPEITRDQAVSMGVVSVRTHPLYREWLMGFVRQPGAPRNAGYLLDTAKAYGDLQEILPDDDPSDALGWPNLIAPREADVLFVGDSFCNGDSAGTRLSPPALFARLTGVRVYNASNGGYGLAQYARIIDHLTRGLPEPERFRGKDVVVLVYLGNDLTADIMLHKERARLTEGTAGWMLELGPLRALASMALAGLGERTPLAHGDGLYRRVPMACGTADGLPFSWHPGYGPYAARQTWTRMLPDAKLLAADLKKLTEGGLDVRMVLIPCSLQVLADDIHWPGLDAASAALRDLPRMAANLEDLRRETARLFSEAGFEVLDVTDAMKASTERCGLFQTQDTHCTSAGYEFIARAVAGRWPRLGR
ncbi:MAG: hypothetical protein ACOZEN_10585 [Thermodesulfobacteriota bacterium]